MDFYVNPTKKLIIEADGKTYARHAIQIPFVNVGDNYDALVKKYVLPIFQPGDILSVSEKIVALCQKRVVYTQDVQPGLLANLLCRCVAQTSAGPGAGVPYKMQFAINQCGTPKILWAAFRAAVDKLRGVHGTFYKIAGNEVYGLDGFYGHDIEEYAKMGIRIPADPDGVCNHIQKTFGVDSMIVDANALAQEILGKADTVAARMDDKHLASLIRDNPAGQVRQLTPFILIRQVPKEQAAELEAKAQADSVALQTAEQNIKN
ncbi:MAG: coenzyme F420-0:L-glutamate ligase [Intestinimonas sp.]|jgi:F420-0:gamma-glutamyl ligase-like protein|nr:coenzyme F420-0:L-glutamate ligase [Intestinimonas sp.]